MGIKETADTYIALLVRNHSGWDPPVALGEPIKPMPRLDASCGKRDTGSPS
jgi:hypothetical protein